MAVLLFGGAAEPRRRQPHDQTSFPPRMHHTLSRNVFIRAAVIASLTVLASSACGESEARNAAPKHAPDIQAFDSTSLLALPESAMNAIRTSTAARRPLSPLADSIANRITFLASIQRAFVAAGREHRLLVDIGRMDTTVDSPARMRAYREAAAARAPLAVGDRLLLRGSWGGSDATVTGYDVWNGRAVVTLQLAANVDSTVRSTEPLVALALRLDSAATPVADSCERRGKLSGALAARASSVGDSLIAALRADTAGGAGGASRRPASKVTRLAGCFGDYSAIIFANIAATSRRPSREIAVLLNDVGSPSTLQVDDLRFRTHEALQAFDADADGVDDVAALGRADRSGGTVVLRLDPSRRRLDYVASGFAWENF